MFSVNIKNLLKRMVLWIYILYESNMNLLFKQAKISKDVAQLAKCFLACMMPWT